MTLPKMTFPKRSLWLSIAAVVAAEAGFLVWMVADRVSLLKSGREITLKVVPVDPRDIFRGDYVVLGYDLTSVTRVTARDGALPKTINSGAMAYVTITPDAEKGWVAAAISDAFPKEVRPSDAVLRGYVTGVSGDETSDSRTVRVRYGIESYFVPEGEGLEIEKQVRDKKIEALVAVDGSGNSALKALMVDGQRIHEQPVL